MPEAPPCTDIACDVLVVGGGINGVGIARDLAGRGLSVVLAEKDDLASHTSSASTKLIHGGLRYLEHYEFALVRKSLAEREVLLKSAPHIMWPMRFVMPHDPGMRPVWMIRTGLFLYDHLARRELLPGSGTISLHGHPVGAPLKKHYTKAFVYSDVWVDDARLVVLNAVDAAERGATVLTRTACVDARRTASEWQITLRDAAGRSRRVRARAMVNAAGPWAAQFLVDHAHVPQRRSLRLIKGSHIIVARLFDHDHAYIFQNPDQRIIFAIPYERDFTLVGTTDVEHTGALGSPRIDGDEVAYLCDQASRYFERRLSPRDVVHTFSGVRPLLDDEADDPSAITRDYALEMDASLAPLLSVWGGKLTTFRKLAEEASDLLAGSLTAPRGAWTEHAVLPGGDLWTSGAGARPPTGDVVGVFERFVEALSARHPELPRAVCFRLARQYGSRADQVIADKPLGDPIAPGLFEAELAYLHTHEWARSAEDVLWRRTKLGLHYDAAQREAVARWCESRWQDYCVAAESAWR
jgi:glycerol-3-phosphate dehydrogenase